MQCNSCWEKDLILNKHFAQRDSKPIVCLVPQFLGDTSDSTIEQVFASLSPELSNQDFLAIHVKPNSSGKISIDLQESGQSLDAVNTSYQAIHSLVRGNRGLVTLKIFTPMMSALSGAIGHAFDSFWHVQEYHFDRAISQYLMLVDSKDL